MPDSLTEPTRKDEQTAAKAEAERQERLANRSVWSLTLWGVASTAKEAEDTLRDIVDIAKEAGMRSGTLNAQNLPNLQLSSAGIPHPRTFVDPTTDEAVAGVEYVKNTPLTDDGLPDPEREAKGKATSSK